MFHNAFAPLIDLIVSIKTTKSTRNFFLFALSRWWFFLLSVSQYCAILTFRNAKNVSAVFCFYIYKYSERRMLDALVKSQELLFRFYVFGFGMYSNIKCVEQWNGCQSIVLRKLLLHRFIEKYFLLFPRLYSLLSLFYSRENPNEAQSASMIWRLNGNQ